MYTLRCPYCGNTWIGEDELDAELHKNLYPCACTVEDQEMSDEDLQVLVQAEVNDMNLSEVQYAS